MGIPILRGRALKPGEAHAIVVGESFAKIGWPDKDALGGKFDTDDDHFTVVGIVGTARLVERENPDAVEAYFPMEPAGLVGASVLVKTNGRTESMMPAMSALAKSIRPDVIPYVQPLKVSFREQLNTIRNAALAVSALGVVALSIACLGIVGLVAYAVSQRTKEIGLRMALGANPAHVLGTLLRQFSGTVCLGLLGGVAGAAGLSQLLRQVLYGISSLDPVAYVVAPGIFAVVAAVAALLPARRALKIDPMLALRYD